MKGGIVARVNIVAEETCLITRGRGNAVFEALAEGVASGEWKGCNDSGYIGRRKTLVTEDDRIETLYLLVGKLPEELV